LTKSKFLKNIGKRKKVDYKNIGPKKLQRQMTGYDEEKMLQHF
jgi:hypothetical protein